MKASLPSGHFVNQVRFPFSQVGLSSFSPATGRDNTSLSWGAPDARGSADYLATTKRLPVSVRYGAGQHVTRK